MARTQLAEMAVVKNGQALGCTLKDSWLDLMIELDGKGGCRKEGRVKDN